MTENFNPRDAPFAIVSTSAVILSSIDEVWPIIGSFHGAERFLGGHDVAAASEAGIGSVRVIRADIVEVMVGLSRYSYTYAQTSGPMARHAYHGCVALEPAGPHSCELTYTLTYDQSSMDEIDRGRHSDELAARFGDMVKAMKAAAEGHARPQRPSFRG